VAVVVFINDPLQRTHPTAAALQMIYRLTPAECRVALLLCDGRAPREIVDTGVTENTVRCRLKQYFPRQASGDKAN